MATVSDLLRRKGTTVHTVSPEETVLAAANLMNQHAVGGLVVVERDRVLGVFTERDILRRVVGARLDPAATSVAEVMTTPVLACRPDTTLEECAAVMTAKRIRHLPVREQEVLAGIVTIGDLLAFQVDEQRATIQYLTSFVYENR
jgi:CBS domain-containing protein